MKLGIISIGKFLQANLLWLLILAYALGAVWPEAGLWIRGVPGTGAGMGWLLKAMLGALLLNAGLRLDPHQLGRLARRAAVLPTTLGASLIVSGLYVLCLATLVGMWDSAGSTQQIALGLAVVAAMPVAASSTAWAQNADGDLALSLGLLLLSTLCCPLTAALLFRAMATMTSVVAAPDAELLVSQATVVFLTLWVLLPVTCGMALRWAVGASRVDQCKPSLKLINLVILLVLNYANASLALPLVLRRPEPLTLTIVAVLALGLAIASLGAAQLVARIYHLDAPQRASLLFAMVMKNNGAGLVLVATAISRPGPLLLPIIVYNLIQHLTAAVLDYFVLRSRGEPSHAREARGRPECRPNSRDLQ
jgi:BASS family bile acid:Na+ symporter